ncbi:MAG: glycosyltransferase family 2 protein [Patescibacteria group bacterium]
MKQQSKPLIGIIILHFGRWEVTKECLDSLEKLEKGSYPLKVVVVNNNQDLLVEDKLKEHPAVDKIITPEKNFGFASGNNLGIKQCFLWKCDYCLFLNNDTVVTPSLLSSFLENLPDKPAVLGPVIEHKVRDRTFYDYGGHIDWKRGQPRHFNKKQYLAEKGVIERDFVSGCCMLIPVKILETIGGFKESYFLYLEDVELCLRAKKWGFKICLVPKAKIFHKGSQSATELTKIFYSWKNSLKLIWEYVPAKFKISALVFNTFFYPALFTKWRIKHLYHKFKP